MNFGINKLNPKYQQNVRLFCIDALSFIIHAKTKDIYEDIANDVEKKFNTFSYEVNRPLPTGKKKMMRLMKDELGGTNMTEFIFT